MASITLLPRKTVLLFLLALMSCSFLGMGKKPVLTVRFYAEANERDTERFAKPIKFRNPPREGFVENIPSIHERMVKSIYPFPAKDGTWGCAFILDNSGRINLEVLSTERRQSVLVAFVGTKTGTHQVVELVIDKIIRDGIITIPYGLTELEVAAMKELWPTFGEKKEDKKKKKPAQDNSLAPIPSRAE